MKIIAGKLNSIVVDSERELLDKYLQENTVFINFSFEGAVKPPLYLKQRKIDSGRKSALESILGFKYPNVVDNEKMMELLYVATDLLENTNDTFFIGTAGCSSGSIAELKDFFEKFLLTNPLRTVVIVDFPSPSLPEFRVVF